MKVIKGDLIQLAKEGKFDVIVHGCNCYRKMGAGIAKQIRLHFPKAYDTDYMTHSEFDMEEDGGDPSKLGAISYCYLDDYSLVVVNAYTQYGYGKGLQVDYSAIRGCFNKISDLFHGKRIAYPKIGAGLGGGDWDRISEIINRELKDLDHTLVIYETN